MSNVVSLDHAPMMWVCVCGCASFSLLSDGSTECCNCGEVEPGDNKWATHDPQQNEYDGQAFLDIHGNNSVEFAKSRIGRLASDADIALVFVAKEGGSTHAWSAATDSDQLDWAIEKIDIARDLIEQRRSEAGE